MRKFISILVLLITLAGAAYTGWRAYSIWSVYKKADNFYDDMANAAVSEVKATTPKPTEAKEEEEASGEKVPIETLGIDMEHPPISLDFSAIRKNAPDIVGWIYCDGSPINYPVVQGKDNAEYLYTMPNGAPSEAGSIFLDAGCEKDFSDDNSIIYGHHMHNGSMFASLSSYKGGVYYEYFPIMWLLTPERTYRVDLFAGVVTSPYSYIYTTSMNESEREAFINRAISESTFDSDVRPKKGEKLITLSTCDYTFNDARYALLGVLREVEE